MKKNEKELIYENFIIMHGAPRTDLNAKFNINDIAENLSIQNITLVKEVFEDLKRENLLKKHENLFYKKGELPLFGIKSGIVKKREAILHKKKIRSIPLLKQKHFDLKDLIISIGMDVYIRNSRMNGLTDTERTSLAELKIYLFQYPPDEIERCFESLIRDNFIKYREYQILGENKAFELTSKGKHYYQFTSSVNLSLNKTESILDLDNEKNIEIFWAWQSEYNPSRTKIKNVLNGIIGIANDEWDPVKPIKLSMATDIGDGAVNISIQLIEKINRAEIFIGDLTPVIKFKNRLYPNSNILIETGYALNSKFNNQVYLLEQIRKIDTIHGDNSKHAKFPFDIAQVRRIAFNTQMQLKSRLLCEIKQSLSDNGKLLIV